DLDQAGYVIAVLQQHKQLVLEILDDEYLAQIYWEDPCIEAAMRSKKSHEARQRYASEKYYRILWRLLERIYLLRCQLVHGAATAGGSLNRTALVRCNTMLSHLLPAVLLVVIDHGEQ